MTREEALNKCIEVVTFRGIYNPYVLENVEYFVEEIYDDFENRTCKNCKWFNKKTYECENKENEQEIGNYDNIDYISMQVDENFGCNRFERKENEKN